MAEPKKSNKERLREITEGIEQGIKDLFESDKYRQYLSTMSRFHRYSVNNVTLIHMQMPGATHVAGYNRWRDQFERHVKKGEHGITIIAPTPFKKKIEEQKLDPDTKAPMLDKDGKVITEEKEIEIPMFRPVKVFDVSQTEGKPLPQLASDLTGSVQQFEAFMEALRRSAPVPISIEPIQDRMDGYFSPEKQQIVIRAGMSEVQTVSAAVHEIAHSKLHNYEKEREAAAAGTKQDAPKKKDRQTEEVEAESISYTVCQYFGIQTGENSFGYIASWSSGKELPELRASLENIQKTSTGLITDIERHFKEICRERGIDLAARQEPAEPSAEPHRYYITQEALDKGTYPVMEGSRVQETAELHLYENSRIEAYGYIEYPQALTSEQISESGLVPAQVAATMQAEPAQEIEGQEAETPVHQDAPAAKGGPFASMLPDAPEQALDEYPMPDEALGVADLEACGYMDGDLLPLSREQAMELFDKNLTVYAIVDGGSAEMLFDREDFEVQAPATVFALSRAEWEASPQFHEKIMERHDHQEEREAAFLAHEGDCFAIYQVCRADPNNVRFMNMDWLQSHELTVERANYDLVYTGELTAAENTGRTLETLYEQFNLHHPADYHHPSMSVSDIVAVKQNGVVSCHYCDSFGFQEVSGFLPQDNPLKHAEMSMEDDYGMIDGIINNGPREPTVAQLEQQARSGQPISLMDLADAVHREQREKKRSVVEQLKEKPKQDRKKAAPKKSAEREI